MILKTVSFQALAVRKIDFWGVYMGRGVFEEVPQTMSKYLFVKFLLIS